MEFLKDITITKQEALSLGIIDGLGFVTDTKSAFKNVNEKILAEIKKGNLIFRKPWRDGYKVKGVTYGAHNYVTANSYKGANAFYINLLNTVNGTNHLQFLTKKQVTERGGTLKNGAKGIYVSAFIKSEKKITDKKTGQDYIETNSGIISYLIYPIEHTSGVKPIKRKTDIVNTVDEVNVDAETLINNMPKKPTIQHGGDNASYTRAKDEIRMPAKKAFDNIEEYYSTLFHELSHSTGHPKRVGRVREAGRQKGDKNYAFEELIAELSAAYLCSVCDMPYYTLNNSAAYLKNWSSVLTNEIKADPRFLLRAVYAATKSAKYIIGTTLEKHGVVKKADQKISPVKQVKPKEKHYPGKEVTPNRTIKASITEAIKDVLSTLHYKSISPMFVGMFYADFKDKNIIDPPKSGLKEKLYEKHSLFFEDYENTEINEAGRKLIDKIKARLATLKAKKTGTDLFPELAGVTDTLLLFLNSVIGVHNKTVTREDLVYIISTLHGAVKMAQIKADHPLRNLANTTQIKVVKLINSLKPKQEVKVLFSNKNEIENKIHALHGLGFWNVIASAVIGKGAELLANKHIFKKKTELSGVNNKPVSSTHQTKKSLSGVMSVSEAINGTFDLIGLEGDYKKLIGEACKPTSIFIYGPGGSGKSTFTLKFSNYLAKQKNKVLYVAGEQLGTPVFGKMLVRLNIADLPNFDIVKKLDTVSPDTYDFIVIDSKDSLNFELEDFIAMRNKHPKLSFVVLSQGTKSGNFTGSEKWRNEVDTLLYCESLKVHSNLDKNRWGGSAEFDILKIK